MAASNARVALLPPKCAVAWGTACRPGWQLAEQAPIGGGKLAEVEEPPARGGVGDRRGRPELAQVASRRMQAQHAQIGSRRQAQMLATGDMQRAFPCAGGGTQLGNGDRPPAVGVQILVGTASDPQAFGRMHPRCRQVQPREETQRRLLLDDRRDGGVHQPRRIAAHAGEDAAQRRLRPGRIPQT